MHPEFMAKVDLEIGTLDTSLHFAVTALIRVCGCNLYRLFLEGICEANSH